MSSGVCDCVIAIGTGTAETARGLLRRVRSEVAICQAEGNDWRSVVDSLRPVTQISGARLVTPNQRDSCVTSRPVGTRIATASHLRSTSCCKTSGAADVSPRSPGEYSLWNKEADCWNARFGAVGPQTQRQSAFAESSIALAQRVMCEWVIEPVAVDDQSRHWLPRSARLSGSTFPTPVP